MNTTPLPPMVQELYAALLEAGVDEDKARGAAEAVRRDRDETARAIMAGLEKNIILSRVNYSRAGFIFLLQMVICTMQMIQLIDIAVRYWPW